MTTSPINTNPVSALEIIAARTSLTTGTLFVLSLGSLHLLQPEMDPTWRLISEYALGRFGWLMTLAFLALAVCLASAGAAVFSQIRHCWLHRHGGACPGCRWINHCCHL